MVAKISPTTYPDRQSAQQMDGKDVFHKTVSTVRLSSVPGTLLRSPLNMEPV